MNDRERHEIDNDPQLVADLSFLRGVAGHATAVTAPPRPDEGTVPVRIPTAERVRSMVATALAQARLRRRRRIRRRLAAAGCAALVVTTLGLLVATRPGGGAAYAATPPLLTITPISSPGRPSVSLEGLAAIAQHDTTGPGRVDHLVTDRWDLNSTVDDGKATSTLVASRRQLWRNDDNEARSIEDDLPAPKNPPGVNGHSGTYYPPREFPAAFPGRPPTDPGALATWLRRSDTSDIAVIGGAADLLAERALTGEERAALLRVLAEDTTLAAVGETRDRAGRPGLAFATTSRSSGVEITHLFVLDPATATFLAYEQILIAGGDALRVHQPAVVAYRVYVSAGFVDEMP